MDKSCHSNGESGATNTSTTITSSSNSSGNNKDHQYLKQLNKFSHKISKPPIRKPSFDHHLHQPLLVPEETQSQPSNLQQQQQQQQNQPPVYNINKSDFRDVVQKLTGSPAHERFSAPPPIHPPKPQSSRLQRIRPPPLAHLTNRPPPLLNEAVLPQDPRNTVPGGAAAGNFFSGQRQVQPLSPLPPFPAVHAAAESPISAYMRYLQSSYNASDSDPKRLTGLSPLVPLVSPRWNSFAPPLPPPLPQNSAVASPTSASMPPLHFPMPLSPLPFGCLPSPSSLLFSPTNQFGFQQFPLSPTLPVPSPRWKGL